MIMPHITSKKCMITYGNNTIDYSLLYCKRKTVCISVHPNSEVIVKVPHDFNSASITTIVQKKARWIMKQMNFFKQFQPKISERYYVNGETHLYLGKQYRLKLLQGAKNEVTLSEGFFLIRSRNEPTPYLAKKLLYKWYTEKARIQFVQRIEHCWKKFSHIQADKPTLAIRKMKRRWGSLSTRGVMTLNTNLIKAPTECIDYVIIHELCHLKHFNHNTQFYTMISSILPQWKEIKHKLEMQ